jgi:hypothetical protein
VSVFLAGEAIFPDMNVFDYAIAFDRDLSFRDRIGRIPRLDFHSESVFAPDDFLSARPRALPEEILARKERFCDFIYSNPDAHPARDALFRKLSEYKRVDSLGPHLNNVGSAGSRFASDWRRQAVELRKPYKFSIAAENASCRGYTSEKILSAFQAFTIPVYWGDPDIESEFNPTAFVNAGRFGSLDALLARVKEIDADDRLWRAMLAEPLMTAAQAGAFRKDREIFAACIRGIFNQNPREAKRAPEGFWPGNYRSWFRRAPARPLSLRDAAADAVRRLLRGCL